ncbi:MAG: A/G-specific adenine glycosylase, partial [Terriglobales bacterium]
MPGKPISFAPPQLAAFRAKLLRWFGAHRRPLPWRQTSDPYCIWISEIMLQQTRVAAVQERYAEFLR